VDEDDRGEENAEGGREGFILRKMQSPLHWSWLGVKVITCLAYKQKLGAGSCLPLPSAPAQSEMIVASINAECCPLVGRRNCARIRFQVIVYDVYDAKGG
jgi:hypothetical protein